MNPSFYLTVQTFLLVGIASGYAVTKQHNRIVSCYYTSSSFYRPGIGKFDVDDIDPDLCTHGFYGFASLNNLTWEAYYQDPWFDLAPSDCAPGYCYHDSYRRFVALKERNPDFHPMLSIGGTEAGEEKYATMAKDPGKRRSFVDSAVELVRRYGFDGVDLNMRYPGPGPLSPRRDPMEPDDFLSLVREFAEALRPNGYIFTTSISGDWKEILNTHYALPESAEHMDFINVMTFNYHGAWDNTTGHNAAIFGRPETDHEDHPAFRRDVFSTVELLLDLGTPPEKIVLGVPTYGTGLRLLDGDLDGLFCHGLDFFPAGPYTSSKGFLGYLEVLQLLHNESYPNLPEAAQGQWEAVVDDCLMAPYVHNGPYWMSYDDPESASFKVRYANLRGLGGVMVWSVDTDDFAGRYSDETFPILRRVNAELAAGRTFDPERPGCGIAPICLEDGDPSTDLSD